MLKISQQQALNRWDTLPDNLREALFSEQNADILWRICEAQHLSEDKIRFIAVSVGDVIMGFIHPEDLAKEIKTGLGLDERLAGAIAREIDKKIFSGIRSEIDKVYAPPAPVVSDIIVTSASGGAELPATSGVELPVAEEIKEIKEISGERKINLEEFQVMGQAGEIIKPTEIKETEKLAEIEKLEPESSAGTPTEPLQPTETPQLIEPAPSPVEPPVASEVKPFILHEGFELKPISETPKSFSLGRFFDFLKKKETKAFETPVVSEVELPVDNVDEMRNPEGEQVPYRAGEKEEMSLLAGEENIKIEPPAASRVEPAAPSADSVDLKEITLPETEKPETPAKVIDYAESETPLKPGEVELPKPSSVAASVNEEFASDEEKLLPDSTGPKKEEKNKKGFFGFLFKK